MTILAKVKQKSHLLLGFSPWFLAIACTLLLLLLSLFAVTSYQREKELIVDALAQKGLTLMRFINSSVRESIRDNLRSSQQWSSWQEPMQAAMQQAVEQPGVEYVVLLDAAGAILAGAGDKMPQITISANEMEFVATLGSNGSDRFITRIVAGDPGGAKKFQLAAWLPPIMGGGMHGPGGRGGRGEPMMQRFSRHPQFAVFQTEMERLLRLKPVYIIQLDYAQFSSPLNRQLLQIVILSVVILLVGIGGALSFITLKGLEGSQKRLGKVEKELQRSERLAALGKMAAGLAHELRNPLSSIKGLAVVLRAGFTAESREAETADILVKEVERLNRSIGELLDYARPEQLKRQEASIPEIINKTVSLVQGDAQSYGIVIHLDTAVDLPKIAADIDKMNQVFLNLFLNAIQAMEQGGRLTVRTAVIARTIVISIRDTGVGISEENLGRIFDPYFTTKSDGTGLGLAMSAKIVEEHGGRMDVTSVLGEWTEVRVILPMAA